MPSLIDKLPPVLGNRLRTRLGKQFTKFALVAIVSLGASELALAIAYYLVGTTPGLAGLIGWLTGAATSYVLSRWAWQRKGRPHLLKETLPFWAISLGAGTVLTSTTHFAGHYAKSIGLPKTEALVVVALAYLAANFVTFVIRFLILHYVLFADRGAQSGTPVEAESLSPVTVAVSVSADEEERRRSR